MTRAIADRLLASDEPSIRWKVRFHLFGDDPPALRKQIRKSARARALIEGAEQPKVYTKWRGAHWALQALADLGYPPGAPELEPIVDVVLDTWMRTRDTPPVDGLHRRCGSVYGGPLLAAIRLGYAGERTDRLARWLVSWQWPDGGWNCDRDPDARSSSLHETFLPMRALHAHGLSPEARRAAEVLLARRLLYRRRDGRLIHADMAKLRYPPYWHYGLLAGLKGLAELGLLADPRCADALEVLRRKQLPDGTWPVEGRWDRPGRELVDWTGPEWVTAEALCITEGLPQPWQTLRGAG